MSLEFSDLFLSWPLYFVDSVFSRFAQQYAIPIRTGIATITRSI